ncbi:MAG TPA: 50S ribosomal protein L25 [Candidatus Atribacteria bacterium]|nr:50S ribosomal protein L25 [Candidatus Atribacteria bacterium]
MEKTKLRVELRSDKGKEVNKKFRRKGIIPGVLYSPHDKKNLLLKVKNENLSKLIYHKRHGIINLEINDGEKKSDRLAIIKDVQYNSLKKQIVHVDFYGVTLKEKLTVEVGVELTGEPVGVKEGGILELELREVEIECLPSQIPESIKADISHLKINDHLTAGELDLPKGVELLTEPDRIIASVHPPTKVEEVAKEEEEVEEEVAEEAEERAEEKAKEE